MPRHTRHNPDPVEHEIQLGLEEAGIPYTISHDRGPDFQVIGGPAIECKRFYSPRAIKQLEGQENILLVQGLEAAKWLRSVMKGTTT